MGKEDPKMLYDRGSCPVVVPPDTRLVYKEGKKQVKLSNGTSVAIPTWPDSPISQLAHVLLPYRLILGKVVERKLRPFSIFEHRRVKRVLLDARIVSKVAQDMTVEQCIVIDCQDEDGVDIHVESVLPRSCSV